MKVKPILVFGRPAIDGAHVVYKEGAKTGEVWVYNVKIGQALDNDSAINVYVEWLKKQATEKGY